jgi:hypothetical protein
MAFFDYDIPQQTFDSMYNYREGLVFLGCGGDLNEWYHGVVEEILEKEGLATRDDFQRPFFLTTRRGRIDLVLPFAIDGKCDIGKLSMWRLRFGSCSWISDYVVNFKKNHVNEGDDDDDNEDDNGDQDV